MLLSTQRERYIQLFVDYAPPTWQTHYLLVIHHPTVHLQFNFLRCMCDSLNLHYSLICIIRHWGLWYRLLFNLIHFHSTWQFSYLNCVFFVLFNIDCMLQCTRLVHVIMNICIIFSFLHFAVDFSLCETPNAHLKLQ